MKLKSVYYFTIKNNKHMLAFIFGFILWIIFFAWCVTSMWIKNAPQEYKAFVKKLKEEAKKREEELETIEI